MVKHCMGTFNIGKNGNMKFGLIYHLVTVIRRYQLEVLGKVRNGMKRTRYAHRCPPRGRQQRLFVEGSRAIA